jgi:hypothetical protein
MTRADGRFVIPGVEDQRPYTLVLTPLGFLRGDIRFTGVDVRLGPLVYFHAHTVEDVRPGEHIELVVHDALPSRGDVLGIGDIVPQPPFLEFVALVQDDPSTPFVELNFEFGGFILQRGQFAGGGTETPIPFLFDGSLWIGATASDFSAGPASIDLGPDIEVVPDTLWGFVLGPEGQVTNIDIIIRAKVAKNAWKGLRNITIVDQAGRQLILPGATEVQLSNTVIKPLPPLALEYGVNEMNMILAKIPRRNLVSGVIVSFLPTVFLGAGLLVDTTPSNSVASAANICRSNLVRQQL